MKGNQMYTFDSFSIIELFGTGICGLFMGSRFFSPLWFKFGPDWDGGDPNENTQFGFLSALGWPLLALVLWLSWYPNFRNHALLPFAICHLLGWLWYKWWLKKSKK